MNSNNPGNLKTILKTSYKLSNYTVDIWNNTLSKLEKYNSKKIVKKELVFKLDVEKDMWNEYLFNDLEAARGRRGLNARFTNFQFAFFAGQVSNFIAREVLNEPERSLPAKPEKTNYISFDDLFKEEYKSNIELFIQLLREIDKPCLDEGYNYNNAYKQKSVFYVWYNALVYKQIIFGDVVDRVEIARLLNGKFNGLNVSPSLYSNLNSTNATENYKDFFDSQIAAIKAKINKLS